jgi:chromosome segregation ATPase
MTHIKRVSMIAAAVVLTAAADSASRPAAAQATAAAAASLERRSGGPGGDDVLPALLTEVKGLRAAMEQMASGSTQAQLLVGRLQLQEGRLTSMIRRLDTVRDNAATARTQYNQLLGSVKMLEQSDEPGDKEASEMPGVLSGLKSQVAAAKANVDRLAAEEMQLTGDIVTEQQRWIAINQRLDELERALAKR